MKILFLQNTIADYNIPLYNQLAENNYEITVAHSDPTVNKNSINYKFSTIYLNKKTLGLFTYHPNFDQCLKLNSYDIIVIMSDIKWITYMKILFIKYSCKKILWGIGVTAGYDSNYDSKKYLNIVRKYLFKKADAVIFYSEYPKNVYIKLGVNENKLFVAKNTVHFDLNNVFIKNEERKDILFIGTLYKQKGIEEFINIFIKNINLLDQTNLKIVGDGPLHSLLKEKYSKYSERIIFYGRITEDFTISKIANSCCVSISPLQAGLSVLKSFAIGLPFITTKNAITGGEIFNIVDGYNGFIFDSIDNFEFFLKNYTKNINKLIKMGQNAKEFYINEANMNCMVKSFIESFKYVKRYG